jgi:E3 ubiquitin-protein ligase synoviolin
MAVYVFLSLLTTIGTVLYAWQTRVQFYPTVIFLVTSKASVLVLCNLFLCVTILAGKLIKTIFLGTLRDREVEVLWENSRFTITNTCLALTIFREELGVREAGLFMMLIFSKNFHWVCRKRVEFMEGREDVAIFQHLRIVSLKALLLASDLAIVAIAVYVYQTKGPTVWILFGFEYLCMSVLIVSTFLRYTLYLRHLATPDGWNGREVYQFYLDLVTDVINLAVYLAFFLIIFTYYGVPLHIVRDLYISFRNLTGRIQECCRARSLTNRLSQVLEDATPEQLEDSPLCIVCRDQMTTSQQIKVLPCGHIFHLHCLQHWIRQRSSCPVCRAHIDEASLGAAAAARQRAAANVLADVAGNDEAAAGMVAGAAEGEAGTVQNAAGRAAEAARDVAGDVGRNDRMVEGAAVPAEAGAAARGGEQLGGGDIGGDRTVGTSSVADEQHAQHVAQGLVRTNSSEEQSRRAAPTFAARSAEGIPRDGHPLPPRHSRSGAANTPLSPVAGGRSIMRPSPTPSPPPLAGANPGSIPATRSVASPENIAAFEDWKRSKMGQSGVPGMSPVMMHGGTPNNMPMPSGMPPVSPAFMPGMTVPPMVNPAMQHPMSPMGSMMNGMHMMGSPMMMPHPMSPMMMNPMMYQMGAMGGMGMGGIPPMGSPMGASVPSHIANSLMGRSPQQQLEIVDSQINYLEKMLDTLTGKSPVQSERAGKAASGKAASNTGKEKKEKKKKKRKKKARQKEKDQVVEEDDNEEQSEEEEEAEVEQTTSLPKEIIEPELQKEHAKVQPSDNDVGDGGGESKMSEAGRMLRERMLAAHSQNEDNTSAMLNVPPDGGAAGTDANSSTDRTPPVGSGDVVSHPGDAGDLIMTERGQETGGSAVNVATALTSKASEVAGNGNDGTRSSSSSPSTQQHPPPVARDVEFVVPKAEPKPIPEVSESTLRRRAAAAAAAERRLRGRTMSRGSEEGFVAEETNNF